MPHHPGDVMVLGFLGLRVSGVKAKNIKRPPPWGCRGRGWSRGGRRESRRGWMMGRRRVRDKGLEKGLVEGPEGLMEGRGG